MSPLSPRVVRDPAIDWVKFDAALARDGSVDPVDKALYAAISSFADQAERATPEGEEDGPTRKILAGCIGRSVDTVDRSTKRLEGYGLLEVERRPDPVNLKRHIPSVYRLLDQHRWDERAVERVRERQARAVAGRGQAPAANGSDAGPGGGRMDAATPGRIDAAKVAAPVRRGWPHGCGEDGRTGAAVLLSVKREEEVQESGARKSGSETAWVATVAAAEPRSLDGDSGESQEQTKQSEQGQQEVLWPAVVHNGRTWVRGGTEVPNAPQIGAQVRSGRRSVATVVPDDFTISDAMRRWAHLDGYTALVDVDFATQKFIDHHRAKGTRFASWPDAWQKWIRQEARYATEHAGGKRGHQPFRAPQDHSAYANGF